ncbi:MAG: hypothetical protein OEV76_12440 [Anaerolineae bacterium]|nr:hypothetical protein [Anaerolineae bacterium]
MEFSYTALAINGAQIRLLAERWGYTNACCDDVLGTIERPDLILRGRGGTTIAARKMIGGGYLLVNYREVGRQEGFVISASIASKIDERGALWRARRALFQW